MALQDLLNLSQTRKKIGLSEERVTAILPIACLLCASILPFGENILIYSWISWCVEILQK